MRFFFTLAVGLSLITGIARAQFATTGTTTVSVSVGAEASIRIDTATTSLTTAGTFAS